MQPNARSVPIRLRLSRARGFRLAEGAVNVARPGPWGNPFVVGKHGDQAYCVELHCKLMGGLICMTTAVHLVEQEKAMQHARRNLLWLLGRDLACWCSQDVPCHGDTLLELANAPAPEPREGGDG